MKDPLDIEWWESPVDGGFDWDVWLFPIGSAVVVAVVLLCLLLC